MQVLKTIKQSALLISAAWLMMPAQANDSSAVIGAGGLVLTQSDAIIMQQEDLFVSESKIRVDYKFRNTSNKDITTRVAFPLPELPAETDMDLSADPQAANPMKFKLIVEGKPRTFETERKTIKHNGETFYKVTHHWLQTFPAGKTLAVTHSYVPITGGAVDYGMHDEKNGRFCIDKETQQWITDIYKKNGHISTGIVEYILTTGANWKGAIGKFKLTLKKAEAKNKLSFCGTGVKKIDDTTFVMEKTNFTPTKDLQVLFLHPYSLENN
jgi:hypothetical protein